MSSPHTSLARFSGPLEEGSFPEALRARVITPGDEPRVHGYDVESDLARHYGPGDLALLALTGELPTQEGSAAFAVVQMFLAPLSVAHASTHAAVLARLCGTTTSSMLGTAAIALGEQAKLMLDEHEELLASLKSRSDTLPTKYRATDLSDDAAIDRLRRALAETGLLVPGLAHRPTRTAGLVMVLYACGLRRRERIEAAIVMARLPCALAEAFAERPTNFGNYPINLPRFTYEESP